MGEAFGETALWGAMPLALIVAALAGMVSFASPCVLPLLPGYLSYVAGIAGQGGPSRERSRVLAGAALFVLGFTAVFTAYGTAFGSLGRLLIGRQELVTRLSGVVVIGMGLAFAGWIPLLWRVRGPSWRPHAGLAGAPFLGVTFGLGWTPCMGPTLAAVQALAVGQGSTGRGAVLSAAYAAGLGVPLLTVAAGLRSSLRAVEMLRRAGDTVTRVGGLGLVAVGSLMVTGVWSALVASLQGWVSAFRVVV